MRTATDLLAEMLSIYDDPDKGAAELYLWIHQWVGDIRETIDRARGEGA